MDLRLTKVAIPPSNSTVSVSIIDTTSWAYKIPCGDLFLPRFPGLDTFDICSYAFLITHDDRHVLFDLGIRKDWENLIPSTVKRLKNDGTIIQVEKELTDILRHGGIDLNDIDAAVWSHIHWDHTGNVPNLPQSVDLVVGPGIKDEYMPGWPANPVAQFHEADVAGRKVVGLEIDDFKLDIGGLKAHDYFGDGSFYLLDAPGHSLGHINALARTSTSPDEFIFLAADSIHLGGELRPNTHLQLPESVAVVGLTPCPCSCDHLTKFHPRSSRDIPYLGLDPSFPEHLRDAEKTIECIQELDADDRVMVIFAHDISLYKTLEFFPANANGWKEKGWKTAGRWAFLADLQKTAQEASEKK
ncbi:metallo-beta-lactamase superfamily protein [Colletotrichum plurivorum]|uniref:Metallo-beta-lactamase superfamily protein n=1 Tax=Colletotrichum plurivorum TaxID=2175906 RepID=A0A8H6NL91_9PEZI|nr:metallo-beta-lactamase superfamily protein [Colletotrichum plurivorum]